MKRTSIGIIVIVLAVLFVAPTILAAPNPAPSSSEDMAKVSEQPVEWFKWGGDIRLREVYTPDLLLNEEDRHFQRYRFRTWTKITPLDGLDINSRLVYEPRHFVQPNRRAKARDAFYMDDENWTHNEAIFDQMNVKWKVPNLPMSLTVGRQDIILGNGWLVLDGTPLDGSRTIFFDAARMTLDLEDIKTKVDMMYINQRADSDRWLKPIGDEDFHNIEQDEEGAILYVTNKSIENVQIDGYYIYKEDEADLGTEAGDIGANRLAPWQIGTDAEIHTLGTRVAGSIGEAWKYRAEAAYEWGRKNEEDLYAYGANTRLEYHLNDKRKNSFNIGYEYLSGDDPDTGDNEQFDPLWGRWPQFSEMLAYTVALENRPGETTNLHRIFVGHSIKFTDKIGLDTTYHALFADQEDAYPGLPYFEDDDDNGSFRGHLLTAYLKWKFNSCLSSHLRGEIFLPGDFYSEDYGHVGRFLRYELMFTW